VTVPTGSPMPEDSSGQEVRLLGQALGERADDVLAVVLRLTDEAGGDILDDAVGEQLGRICRIATIAVAEWMSGGRPEDGLDAGREAWELFGALAAHRAAPLHEVTKRCLRWRDGVGEMLRATTRERGCSKEVLRRALAMTQVTLDVTLVRMCEVFEAERQKMDAELSEHQERLAFMATHDQLTGLPNRTLIIDRADQMLSRARRNQTPVAALHMNLDNFTAVNDTLGHQAGDELLRAISARLDGIVRDTDALGRLGGDEFIVIVEEDALAAGALLIADRLQEALGEPFKLEAGNELLITASIGLAVGEQTTAEHLLGDAEIAAHRAKWEGKNRAVVFEDGMQDLAQRHMQLELDLRGALERGEFFLVYQPTFDLSRMMPTGVETLIRWRCPTRGVVSPNDFIPLLEETGLIVAVGRWVLAQACLQGATWRTAGHPVSIAVNVSARQLDDDEFVGDVEHALAVSGLEPTALTLEITETALMRNADETAARLHAIKRLGVRIAIDDFGTGYSSLSHLQRFPVDSLKIDRSFLVQIAENPEGGTLIRTLVRLGKALSIETLAEGIEHAGQLTMLREEQCDSGQGFLFARPLEAHAAELFLRDWRVEDGQRLQNASQAAETAQGPGAG
jgi:diguanylate cyclase (GGDEF)-like protein